MAWGPSVASPPVKNMFPSAEMSSIDVIHLCFNDVVHPDSAPALARRRGRHPRHPPGPLAAQAVADLRPGQRRGRGAAAAGGEGWDGRGGQEIQVVQLHQTW